MKTTKVKNVLLTLASLIGAPAIAQEAPSFTKIRLIDELPVQYRAGLYSQIVDHLQKNPEMTLNPDHIFAVEESGSIVVLDRKWLRPGSLGAPSCIEKANQTNGHLVFGLQDGLEKKGVVYVLDGAIINPGPLGAPSCITE